MDQIIVQGPLGFVPLLPDAVLLGDGVFDPSPGGANKIAGAPVKRSKAPVEADGQQPAPGKRFVGHGGRFADVVGERLVHVYVKPVPQTAQRQLGMSLRRRVDEDRLRLGLQHSGEVGAASGKPVFRPNPVHGLLPTAHHRDDFDSRMPGQNRQVGFLRDVAQADDSHSSFGHAFKSSHWDISHPGHPTPSLRKSSASSRTGSRGIRDSPKPATSSEAMTGSGRSSRPLQ